MKGVVIVVQIVISLVIVAVTMPVLLALVPAAQNSTLGPLLAVGISVLVFVLLRLGWPRPAR